MKNLFAEKHAPIRKQREDDLKKVGARITPTPPDFEPDWTDNRLADPDSLAWHWWDNAQWRIRNPLPGDILLEATATNTAMLTIAAYPKESAMGHVDLLARTAKKVGTDLHILGVGIRYVSHYQSKVVRMIDWINALDPAIEYVAYIDGKDSIFVRPLADLCAAFNTLGREIVLACENHHWPVLHGRWQAQFPARHAGRNFPQAGFWMGERQAIVAALGELKKLHDEIESGKSTGILAEMRRHITCDQVMWQAAISSGRVHVGLDDHCRLAVTTTGLDKAINGKSLAAVKNKVIVRDSNSLPSLMHFPGRQWEKNMEQWAEALGLIDDKYSALPRQKIDLVVFVGTCRENKVCWDRQESCRDTWFGELRNLSNVATFFMVGDVEYPKHSQVRIAGDTLIVPLSDNFDNYTPRTIASVQYALDHYDFKYIFLCGDDTYVHVERLMKMFAGLTADCIGRKSKWNLLGGAGYFISPRAARIVAKIDKFPFGLRMEDLNVPDALIKAGIMPENDNRLHGHDRDPNTRPTAQNNSITTHNIADRETMLAIHRGA